MELLENEKLKQYGMMFLGSAIMAIGISCFIVPLNLYNGGCIGIAQIIRSACIKYGGITFKFDVAGLINLLLNIPLMIMAYFKISKKFCIRTIICVGTQSLLFSLINLKEPIITDTLSACVIGGVISAYGCGVLLRSGGSSGGFDILGVYFAKNKQGASVGQISAILNGIIYCICALMFELPTAIYSILYSLIFSFVVDKVHYQNINVSVTIISKVPYLQDIIMFDLARGATVWKAIGGYTESEVNVIFTIINKYEINQLKKAIYNVDPQAFIVVNEGLEVSGNYEKRL